MPEDTQIDRPQLPNTDVNLCEHPSHQPGESPRANTLIRFAMVGEVMQFHACAAHAKASDFGYLKPASGAEELVVATRETDSAASPSEPTRILSDDAVNDPEVVDSVFEHGDTKAADPHVAGDVNEEPTG